MTSFSWPVAVLCFLTVDKYRAILLGLSLSGSSHTNAEPSVFSFLGLARVTACPREATLGDGVDVSSVGALPSSGESVWAAVERTIPYSPHADSRLCP